MKTTVLIYGIAVLAFAFGYLLRGLIALGDLRALEELRKGSIEARLSEIARERWADEHLAELGQ